MLYIPALTLILVFLSAFIHYEALGLCNAALPRLRLRHNRVKVLMAVGVAFVSHLLQIGLFALAYYYVQSGTDLGRISGKVDGVAASLLYFSIETYTSLGFGDVFPSGPIRMVAGVEALTGLVMIGWTASFTYLEMNRYWESEKPNPRSSNTDQLPPQSPPQERK